ASLQALGMRTPERVIDDRQHLVARVEPVLDERVEDPVLLVRGLGEHADVLAGHRFAAQIDYPWRYLHLLSLQRTLAAWSLAALAAVLRQRDLRHVTTGVVPHYDTSTFRRVGQMGVELVMESAGYAYPGGHKAVEGVDMRLGTGIVGLL